MFTVNGEKQADYYFTKGPLILVGMKNHIGNRGT